MVLSSQLRHARAPITRSFIAVIAVAAALLTAASCGSRVEKEGTNTNWGHCTTNADCADADPTALCVSGMCQVPGDTLVACNDGTDNTACCSDSVASGATCSGTDHCWTRCSGGQRMQFVCSDGAWLAGHGLFPCGPDGGTTDASISDAAVNWPACTWPSDLLPLDASFRETCGAARTMLSCDLGGSTAVCLSDDPIQCSDGSTGGAPCTPMCAPNEYAAICGGVGPGPIPDPPANCRWSFPNPAGVGYYCCPCDAPSDGGVDARDSGLLTCTTSVESWCSQPFCIPEWPSDPSVFCGLEAPPPGGPLSGKAIAETCGQYHVLKLIVIDVGYSYYYDATSGHLVAVVFSGPSGGQPRSCEAGPATFVEPSCDSQFVWLTCNAPNDAGSTD